MTTTKREETLLRRLAEAKFPLNYLAEPGSGPLARLMLESADVERRASEHWTYKSLAHLGEERFVALDPSNYLFSGNSNWRKNAPVSFAESVVHSLWNEVQGLLLYVTDETGVYREAKAGDSAYDIACSLRSDGMLRDLSFEEAPQWAKNLFLYRTNYDAWRLVWYEAEEVTNPEAVRAKRELVRREMDRQVLSQANTAKMTVRVDAKDMVRVRDVAAMLVGKRAINGADATAYVNVLMRNDNSRVWLVSDDSLEGPALATSEKGCGWARALVDSSWWRSEMRSHRTESFVAEHLSMTNEDAERLFPAIISDSVALQNAFPSATRSQVSAPSSIEEQSEIDPGDLPDELDVANQAFRAVQNGYGEQSTFRNRLVAWLAEHRSDLKAEARDRIATVANPDKTPGRRASQE